MSDPDHLLLQANLKLLRRPTINREFGPLVRQAADGRHSYEQYLLSLTELEVTARASHAWTARTKRAGFPGHKDFDTFDFSVLPRLNEPKVLELARAEWLDQHDNLCLIGSPGTGKTHLAMALGLAACLAGPRVRIFTAAGLVGELVEAQQRHQLERLLSGLDEW